MRLLNLSSYQTALRWVGPEVHLELYCELTSTQAAYYILLTTVCNTILYSQIDIFLDALNPMKGILVLITRLEDMTLRELKAMAKLAHTGFSLGCPWTG